MQHMVNHVLGIANLGSLGKHLKFWVAQYLKSGLHVTQQVLVPDILALYCDFVINFNVQMNIHEGTNLNISDL